MILIKWRFDKNQPALFRQRLLLRYMFLQKIVIAPDSLVSNMVRQNHNTAAVFRKYEIEYCCGGNWPLKTVCMSKGIEFEVLKKELEDACRKFELPPLINYDAWKTDFLVSYIINIHHQFLKHSLTDTASILKDFADGHRKKYPEIHEVSTLFNQLQLNITPHLKYEEETIFPYILQIAHAHENKDSYAKLLVKTLRKPIQFIMKNEEDDLSAIILKIRLLTNNYTIPEKACVSHILSLCRLRDLDSDLMQHIYLENEILFPRALQIETELLK